MRLLSSLWRTTAATLALALALTLLGSGCPCDSGWPLVFYDDFEGGEDDGSLPARWLVESGQAAWVSTYHAGEHGIRLWEHGTIVSNPSGANLNAYAYDTAYLHASCRAAGLTIEIEVTDESGEPFTIGGTATPGDDLHMPSVEIILTPVRLGVTHAVPIQTIRIEQTGSGTCVVDELRLVSGQEAECW